MLGRSRGCLTDTDGHCQAVISNARQVRPVEVIMVQGDVAAFKGYTAEDATGGAPPKKAQPAEGKQEGKQGSAPEQKPESQGQQPSAKAQPKQPSGRNPSSVQEFET